MQRRSKAKKTSNSKRKTAIVLRVGRPNSYEADEFFEACKAYFKSLRFFNKPNIAGLCLFLGISRETWYDYRKKRKELSDTIRAVELAIETAWIDKLGSSYATGAIFYLKNFKPSLYKDTISGDPENPLTLQITGMKISKE